METSEAGGEGGRELVVEEVEDESKMAEREQRRNTEWEMFRWMRQNVNLPTRRAKRT